MCSLWCVKKETQSCSEFGHNLDTDESDSGGLYELRAKLWGYLIRMA